MQCDSIDMVEIDLYGKRTELRIADLFQRYFFAFVTLEAYQYTKFTFEKQHVRVLSGTKSLKKKTDIALQFVNLISSKLIQSMQIS